MWGYFFSSKIFLFWDILRCRSSFFFVWFGGSDSILGFLVKLYVMQLYIFLLCHSWHCISWVFHCSFTSILIMSQTYEPDKKSSFLSVFHLETGFSNVLIFLGCLLAKSHFHSFFVLSSEMEIFYVFWLCVFSDKTLQEPKTWFLFFLKFLIWPFKTLSGTSSCLNYFALDIHLLGLKGLGFASSKRTY